MNWYSLLKTSFVKSADPHSEETCPECGTEFVLDLLWEKAEEASSYNAVDDHGQFLNAFEARDAAMKGHTLDKEWSYEKVSCPSCGKMWLSEFLRKPKESNYPQEKIIHTTPLSDNQFHSPRSLL